MDFQTAIKTLELNAGFSLVDVKRNYYKLSLKWHPDKNTSINSTKKFQEIAEAYEFLKIYLDLENRKFSIQHVYYDEESVLESNFKVKIV